MDVVVAWAEPVRTAALDDLLSDVERARVSRYRVEADRARFVTGRALARRHLAPLLGVDPADVTLDATCPDCGRQHGRPVVVSSAEPVPHLGIAHSGDRVLIAVTGAGPVGIDVERCAATGFEGFDTVALTAGERRAVHQLPAGERPAARATVWTRKEAMVKLHGRGLRIAPDELEMGLAGAWSAPAALSTSWGLPIPAAPAIQLVTVEVGVHYRACVAVASSSPPSVRVIDDRAALAELAAGARPARS